MNSKTIKSFMQLDEEEKNIILGKYAFVSTQICVCRDFIAVLRTNSYVVLKTEQEEKVLFKNVIRMAAGQNHIACLCSDGTVMSYGDNTYHQCEVSEWKGISDLTAYHNMTVGISADGEIFVKGTKATLHENDLNDQLRHLTDHIKQLENQLESAQEKFRMMDEYLNRHSSTVLNLDDTSTLINDIEIVYEKKNGFDIFNNYELTDIYVGKILDRRYNIKKLIGIGNFAKVYQAIDSSNNQIVAIKILNASYLKNEKIIKYFKENIKSLIELSYDNITKIRDLSFGDRIQYIVTDYVDGITLNDFIEYYKTIPWRKAVCIAAQVLKCLYYAHSNNVIHKNVTPNNIMLMLDGTVKLTDFGLDFYNNGGLDDLTIGDIPDFPYMSVEQKTFNITNPESDIFSVGVILYEMLVGYRPFDGLFSAFDIDIDIGYNPKSLCLINADVPEGLEEIVFKSLKIYPQLRYSTVNEMIDSLEKIIKDPNTVFNYDCTTSKNKNSSERKGFFNKLFK